ncbi:MAG TPA: hypothetical protein VH372_03110 [Actinospica sp.]|nr:hypothetical protein [Actinospica sp.]
MSGLIGEESNRAQAAPDGDHEQAAQQSAAAPATAKDAKEPRGRRIRNWFGALLRSAIALVITLVVLAVAGGITDVVLHVTRHTSTSSTAYAGIDGVVVVLDGDISLNVVGQPQSDGKATLSSVDTSTPFDDPVRTGDVVGGTLYLTERCPDSRCSAQLTLTVNTDDTVNVVSGNGLRLDESVVELRGIVGQASVLADPARVIVINTIATGAVIGRLQCDTVVDCRDITAYSKG